jgi:hypothetical protein
MAIAFDTAVDGSFVAPATSQTWSHTCTGTDRVLIVAVITQGSAGGDVVSGITYNTVAMTRINTDQLGASTSRTYLYYLINPASGANNVVVSYSTSITAGAISSSYTGADQVSQPDSSNTGDVSGVTTITVNQTTVADNDWLFGCFFEADGVGSAFTAGANTVQRIAHAGFPRFRFHDSNSAQTPPGSKGQTYNWTTNSAANMLVGSLDPSGGAVVTTGYSQNNLALLGVS